MMPGERINKNVLVYSQEEVNLSNIAIFYGTMIAGKKSMTFHSKILDPQNAPLNSSLGGAHVVHHKS